MMRSDRQLMLAAFAVVISLLAPPAAEAQQRTVQQPAFSSNSAATTVVVPDRGRAHVGGSSSAAIGRSSAGSLGTRGSSYGLERRGEQMTADVQIHDMAAMDAALLGQAPPRLPRHLPPRGTPVRPATTIPAVTRPDYYLARAAAAEQAGKPEVAATYRRLAARKGASSAGTAASRGAAGDGEK